MVMTPEKPRRRPRGRPTRQVAQALDQNNDGTAVLLAVEGDLERLLARLRTARAHYCQCAQTLELGA